MRAILLAVATIISFPIMGSATGRSDVGTDAGKRYVLSVQYQQGKETSVDMAGTPLAPSVDGKAEVKRTEGRTRIELKMYGLRSPQAVGSFYTTYVLWAVAPEGQADNLAEIPFDKDKEEIDVTTSFQAFGLILTAEPYSAVKLPSPAIVAENILRRQTKGKFESSRIEYRGDPGTLYATESLRPDYDTPLIVLGARRAVEIAKRAGANQYAEPELRQAEVDLAALEQVWPEQRRQEKKFGGMARDVMRIAENARELSLQRAEQAGLDSERRSAENNIARAQGQAETARNQAAIARDQAEAARREAARAQQDADAARTKVAQAQTEAERARANEELAKAQAEQAQLQADKAKQDKEDAEQRLYQSLSAILETKREARGLIVSLSDVLFDFNKATLKPGAREKLSKLAGILLAYPGPYHLEIDGYTDAIGSDEYNLKLSEGRANSVRAYLVQASLPEDRIIAVKGYGKEMPVTTNATPEGRQMNRRVEIVISDTTNARQASTN
ncbi:MAG TPA: OmpA family protein [Blastocatellia bacterium]|nr:OmpA family protein [Blastocatellia bacterium]